MATIKYRLRGTSKTPSITLQLSLGRGRVYEKKTGFSIQPKAWSKDMGFPKQTMAEYKDISLKLKDLETEIFDQLNKAQSRGQSVDSTWLGQRIDIYFGRLSETGASNLVTEAIKDVIENAHLRKNKRGERGISKSRIGQYRRLLSLFEEFQGKRKLTVMEIDAKTGKDFFKFLFDTKGYDESYVLKMMANLKTVCYEAEINGAQISPQLKTIESGKPANKHIIYLTPDELTKVEKAPIIQPHLQNARKWLLLGSNVGQRGSDLLGITEDSIAEINGMEVIEVTQKKTGKKVHIPILPKTRQIIDQGLPHRISLAKLNKYVKEVCKLSGIDELTKGKKTDSKTKRKVTGTFPKYELIASHTFRRTFCSNLHGEILTPIIMQVTGHATEKTFLAYIGREGMDYKEHWQRFIEKEKSKAIKEPKLTIVPKLKIDL